MKKRNIYSYFCSKHRTHKLYLEQAYENITLEILNLITLNWGSMESKLHGRVIMMDNFNFGVLRIAYRFACMVLSSFLSFRLHSLFSTIFVNGFVNDPYCIKILSEHQRIDTGLFAE